MIRCLGQVGLGLLMVAGLSLGADADSFAHAVDPDRIRWERDLRCGVQEYAPSRTATPPDFKLSEDMVPARFAQDRSVPVRLGDSAWIVFFEDSRDGRRAVYRQVIDTTGAPVGANVVVARSVTGSNVGEPRARADSLGQITVTWRDQGLGLIWLARFDAALLPVGSPILVNDTTAAAVGGLYDLAVWPDGRLVVVFENYTGLGNTITAQRYTAGLVADGAPITVPSSVSITNRWAPTVDVQPDGGFLVAWEDYVGGEPDISCRLFSAAGSAIGPDFLVVPPPASAASQLRPNVLFSPLDDYVIAWVDQRAGQGIWAQRYDPISGLIDSNVRLSESDTAILADDPQLSLRADSTLDLLWSSFGATNRVMARRVQAGLVPDPSRVLNLSNTDRRWRPRAESLEDGHYLTTWTEIEIDQNVHGMLFEAGDSRVLGSEVLINDDSAGSFSDQPVILSTSDWWQVSAFVDRRNDAGDIYVQAVINDGSLPAPNVRVNADGFGTPQASPRLAQGDASVLVAWLDSRTVGGISGQRVFGRQLTIWGSPPAGGLEFLVSDTTSSAAKTDLAIAAASDSSAIVSWIDSRTGQPEVYGRWLTTAGTQLSAEFLLSAGTGSEVPQSLSAAADGAGYVAVSWLDLAAGEVRIHLNRPDRTVQTLLSWTPTAPGVAVSRLALDRMSNGDLCLFWTSQEVGGPLAYLTVLDSLSGVVFGPSVIASLPTSQPESPAISVDANDNLVLAWIDHREGLPRAYRQILSPSFGPIGTAEAISTEPPEFMEGVTVSANLGRAWFGWVDNRIGGLSVWANTLVYDPTDVADDTPVGLPLDFSLGENYPNPFNPTTTIPFSLATPARVSLSIYNVLGQEVARLIEQPMSAGEHRVTWDGRDRTGREVASGVYFYRLIADDFREMRKMLLLR